MGQMRFLWKSKLYCKSLVYFQIVLSSLWKMMFVSRFRSFKKHETCFNKVVSILRKFILKNQKRTVKTPLLVIKFVRDLNKMQNSFLMWFMKEHTLKNRSPKFGDKSVSICRNMKGSKIVYLHCVTSLTNLSRP